MQKYGLVSVETALLNQSLYGTNVAAPGETFYAIAFTNNSQVVYAMRNGGSFSQSMLWLEPLTSDWKVNMSAAVADLASKTVLDPNPLLVTGSSWADTFDHEQGQCNEIYGNVYIPLGVCMAFLVIFRLCEGWPSELYLQPPTRDEDQSDIMA